MYLIYIDSNQVEKHYPDGRKEVTFSDGTIRYIHPNGGEECCFENGTIQKVQPDGNHTIEFPNGQKEIYTKEFKVLRNSTYIAKNSCTCGSVVPYQDCIYLREIFFSWVRFCLRNQCNSTFYLPFLVVSIQC